MQSPTAAPAAFGDAARRHLADGQHLLAAQRHVTADHLAGLSAECGLKAILVEFAAVAAPTTGPPILPGGTKIGHLPTLWDQIGAYISGRSAPQFSTLLSMKNPFNGWQIEDRYADGTTITESIARDHLKSAMDVMALHEQAQVNGAIP